MRINDTETQAIADLYREMIGEQTAGKSALTGQELVTALVTACMSKWYDLTSKFQSRPEIYDVAPTDANDAYNVMKLNPGSDVRDDAFEAIVKSTNDIAKELNRLFGKDVFEPRITRQHGKLEALVAFSANEGGVFQAKGEATEGHTTIHITMPKEAELERAFSAMTDTPHHGDGDDSQGVGDLDDTLDADPIAGDPSPDYDPEFDVADDADQAEVDAEFGDLDAEPEGDPMDDLSADEADAAFEDEPRRPRGRFEGLYLDSLDVLSESDSTEEEVYPEYDDEHVHLLDKPIVKYVQSLHDKVKSAVVKKYKAEATEDEGAYAIGARNAVNEHTVLNSYLAELSRVFGTEFSNPQEKVVVNDEVYMSLQFHVTPIKDTNRRTRWFRMQFNSRIEPVEMWKQSFRDHARKITIDVPSSIDEAADDMKPHKYVVKDENGKPKYEKTFPNKRAAEDFRDRQTDKEMIGGVVMPVEATNESFEETKGFEPMPKKPCKDSDPKKKPMPKKPGTKDDDKDKAKAKTFREFVDDKEDGRPGWSPSKGNIPLDMNAVDELERKFVKAIRDKLVNRDGGNIVGPISTNVRGVDIETAHITYEFDWEQFERGEFDSYARQVISHWKRFVGGDEEFDATPDPDDTDSYRLRGCEHLDLKFDVYIKDKPNKECHIDRIRSAEAPTLGESCVNDAVKEEAPAVSVGAAQSAGSSPSPEVVKDIGKKKKKTKVQRRNEAVDAEMDAINEALKRGLI